jgi:hypothetical protein
MPAARFVVTLHEGRLPGPDVLLFGVPGRPAVPLNLTHDNVLYQA